MKSYRGKSMTRRERPYCKESTLAYLLLPTASGRALIGAAAAPERALAAARRRVPLRGRACACAEEEAAGATR
jgi:hypothetical protein